MINYKDILIQLTQNLNILREREAKYGGSAPLDLLNQITDHEQAITLTKQADRGEITETEWREALRPLLVNIRDRSESQPDLCGVTIGDVEGGIIGSIIAGRDIIAGGDIVTGTKIVAINQAPEEPPFWRRLSRANLILTTVLGLIATTAAVLAVPQFNTWLLPSPTPTATPLPITPAADGEGLILIATFHETSNIKTEPHVKIKRAIEDAVKEVGLATLRVEIEPTILTADQREKAEALGKQYNADMVIWGEDTGVQVLVNFYNRTQPDFYAADVKISEEQRTQIVNPSAYAEFVLSELPRQLTFLALFAVGQRYSYYAQYSQAIDVIKVGVMTLDDEAKPDGLVEAYFWLGWLYQAQTSDELEQAIRQHPAPLDLPPSLTTTHNNRYLTYQALEQYEQVLANYNRAIALDPEYAPAYYNRGNVYQALEQYEQALADLNRAIALDPEYAPAYYNRGNVYVDLQQYEQALADYNRAIELNSEFAMAYYNRGLTYAAQSDLERAIESFETGLQSDTNPTTRQKAQEDLANLKAQLTSEATP